MYTVLGDTRDLVGESPTWSVAENAVWWVDVWGRALRRHVLGEHATDTWTAPEMAGGIALGEQGQVYGLLETGLFTLDRSTGRFHPRSAPDALPHTHRFNDVTVDPAGRIVAGTMRKSDLGPAPTGTLYVFDGAWRTLFDGFWTVNGLAFAPDGRTLYMSDSHPAVQRIWAADYDPETGMAGARRVLVDMAGYAGRPDGAAVDAEGFYWIAGIGGGRLYRFDPSGRLRGEIEVPVERPTKVAFGGPNLDQVMATSMSVNLARPDREGLAGALLGGLATVKGSAIPLARL